MLFGEGVMPTNDSRTLTRFTKTATVHKVIDITPDPVSEPRAASSSPW